VSAREKPLTQEALLDAMAQLLAERGYQETTIEQVTAAAGLPREDFGRCFSSKEECALAAVEKILVAAIEAVASSYSPDTSERESALAALRALLELFAARPPYANLAFIASRQGMPAAAVERYRSAFAILTPMLDRLRADMGTTPPPATATRAAIGGGEALVRRELAKGRAEQLPEILPDLVYSAAVPFLGQRDALRLARQRGHRASPAS
jgi:AcrR family transcriptional regulator